MANARQLLIAVFVLSCVSLSSAVQAYDVLSYDTQLALTGLGYAVGAIDGDAGAQTQDAIRQFQKDSAATVTEIFSEDLLRALSQKFESVRSGLLSLDVKQINAELKACTATAYWRGERRPKLVGKCGPKASPIVRCHFWYVVGDNVKSRMSEGWISGSSTYAGSGMTVSFK